MMRQCIIRYVLVVGGRSAESLDERIRAWPKGYVRGERSAVRRYGHRVSRKKSDLLSRQSSVDISPELPAVTGESKEVPQPWHS